MNKIIILEDTDVLRKAIERLQKYRHEYTLTGDETILVRKLRNDTILRRELIVLLQEDIRDIILHDLKNYINHTGYLTVKWTWDDILERLECRLYRRMKEIEELM